MSATRTVFLDVDGTLVDHTQRLAPSVVEAVQGARRNGHLVFVATGRSRSEIPESVLDIGFDGVISAAGGYLEYQGVLIAEHTLPEADVEEIAEFLGRHNVEYNLQAFDAVFPSLGLTALIERAQAHNADVSDARAAAGASLPGPGSGERIAKVTFYGEHASTYATVRDGLWGVWWPLDKGGPVGSRFEVHTRDGVRRVDPAAVRVDLTGLGVTRFRVPESK